MVHRHRIGLRYGVWDILQFAFFQPGWRVGLADEELMSIVFSGQSEGLL